MCHFHQKMIVQRYVTRKPKLEASKDLKRIVSRLTSTTQIRFENKLDQWYQKYEEFINEKSINPTTGLGAGVLGHHRRSYVDSR